VLSADAILLTATIFLFGRFLGRYVENPETIGVYDRYFIGVIIVFVIVAIGFLCLSILAATSSVVNVWVTSHEMLGKGTPQIYFFHARDTYQDFKDFTVFKSKLDSATDKEMLIWAEAELWRVIVATYFRHNDLKKAIRLLYYAIFPFFITLLIFSAMLTLQIYY